MILRYPHNFKYSNKIGWSSDQIPNWSTKYTKEFEENIQNSTSWDDDEKNISEMDKKFEENPLNFIAGLKVLNCKNKIRETITSTLTVNFDSKEEKKI